MAKRLISEERCKYSNLCYSDDKRVRDLKIIRTKRNS